MQPRQLIHKQWMFTLLKLLYSSAFGKHLGFKGGTALYFFHQLPRFSVDLDFDVIQSPSVGFKDDLCAYLQTHLKGMGATIKQDGTLEHSFRYIIQYGGDKKCKIECASYTYPNHYMMENLLGTYIQVMDVRRMFAHKLCAFFSRQERGYIANRDLFDILFLFKKHILPHEGIIQIRSQHLFGKAYTIQQLYAHYIEYIQKNRKHLQKNILDGLGELLNTQQKSDIKNTLVDDLLEQFQLQLL